MSRTIFESIYPFLCCCSLESAWSGCELSRIVSQFTKGLDYFVSRAVLQFIVYRLTGYNFQNHHASPIIEVYCYVSIYSMGSLGKSTFTVVLRAQTCFQTLCEARYFVFISLSTGALPLCRVWYSAKKKLSLMCCTLLQSFKWCVQRLDILQNIYR